MYINSGNCEVICSDKKQISGFLEMGMHVGRHGKDGLQRDREHFGGLGMLSCL